MIEEIDHERAVRPQTDVSALIDIADVDQDRIPILTAPAFDLGRAAGEPAEIPVPDVIARRQNVSVQIGGVNN